MTDVRSAWKDAGERLSALGSALRTHYDEQRAEDAAQTKEEVGDAVKRLTGAVQDAFEALGAAAKDTSVRDDAKKAGQSVVGALSATFAEISEDLRKVADKGVGEKAGTDKGVDEAPTVEATVVEPPSKPAATPTEAPTVGDDEPRVEPWGTP